MTRAVYYLFSKINYKKYVKIIFLISYKQLYSVKEKDD